MRSADARIFGTIGARNAVQSFVPAAVLRHDSRLLDYMESDGTGKMKVQNGDGSDGDGAAPSTVSLDFE